MSPSTLSRQIQRREEAIGQPLLIQDNPVMRLTQAGEQLKIFAQQTLWQYQPLRHLSSTRCYSQWEITPVLLSYRGL